MPGGDLAGVLAAFGAVETRGVSVAPWLHSDMMGRLPKIVLAGVGLVGASAVLLVAAMDSEAAVIDQQIGPTRCAYDTRTNGVLMSVPLRVEVTGEVTMEVRVEVHDRRDPDRMPYVSTELITFSNPGTQEERVVVRNIAMPEREWRAGFDECGVDLRIVRQP